MYSKIQRRWYYTWLLRSCSLYTQTCRRDTTCAIMRITVAKSATLRDQKIVNELIIRVIFSPHSDIPLRHCLLTFRCRRCAKAKYMIISFRIYMQEWWITDWALIPCNLPQSTGLWLRLLTEGDQFCFRYGYCEAVYPCFVEEGYLKFGCKVSVVSHLEWADDWIPSTSLLFVVTWTLAISRCIFTGRTLNNVMRRCNRSANLYYVICVLKRWFTKLTGCLWVQECFWLPIQVDH